MRQRLQIKRLDPPTSSTLISTIRSYLPGAWVAPKTNELITLYRLRYRMALEEQKYDSALIFLNKILELDPMNAEAKLCKGEIYHRCLQDYPRAIISRSAAVARGMARISGRVSFPSFRSESAGLPSTSVLEVKSSRSSISWKQTPRLNP